MNLLTHSPLELINKLQGGCTFLAIFHRCHEILGAFITILMAISLFLTKVLLNTLLLNTSNSPPPCYFFENMVIPTNSTFDGSTVNPLIGVKYQVDGD